MLASREAAMVLAHQRNMSGLAQHSRHCKQLENFDLFGLHRLTLWSSELASHTPQRTDRVRTPPENCHFERQFPQMGRRLS